MFRALETFEHQGCLSGYLVLHPSPYFFAPRFEVSALLTTSFLTTSSTARPHEPFRTIVFKICYTTVAILIVVGPEIVLVVRFAIFCIALLAECKKKVVGSKGTYQGGTDIASARSE